MWADLAPSVARRQEKALDGALVLGDSFQLASLAVCGVADWLTSTRKEERGNTLYFTFSGVT